MESTEKYKFSNFFKERLRSLMKARDFNQAKLAAECGVTQPAVHGWLSGVQPKAYEIYRLGLAFGVHPMFLIFEDAPSQMPMQSQTQCSVMREDGPDYRKEAERWKAEALAAKKELADLRASLQGLAKPVRYKITQ